MSNWKDEMDKTVQEFFNKLDDMLEHDEDIEVNSTQELIEYYKSKHHEQLER